MEPVGLLVRPSARPFVCLFVVLADDVTPSSSSSISSRGCRDADAVGDAAADDNNNNIVNDNAYEFSL